MIKNSDKVIFVGALIVGIFFARVLYPKLLPIPQLSAAADPQALSAGQNMPPTLVLPPITSVGGDNDPSTSQDPAADVGVPTTPSFFTPIGNLSTPPSFDRTAYLIADLTTGSELADVNAASRWPTASLTKLMTATVVLDNISTSTIITITPEMFAADPEEETLVVGGSYSVEDLLHLMLMPSSNVAAEAMADFFGRDQFMQQMNARATAWGMKDTYFDDPSGISAANESTANDLLIVAQHVYNDYPQILAITRTPQTTIVNRQTNQRISIASINDFAGEPNFIGGKTGHTNEAGGNLLSIFNYENHPVMVLVLGTTDRFGDTSKLFEWFRQNYK